MLNLGLHTEFLRPSEEDALMTATGSVVRLSVELRSSVCRLLLLEDLHRILINQECSLLLHKYFDMSAMTDLLPELHGSSWCPCFSAHPCPHD